VTTDDNLSAATRGQPRVALVTCRGLPDLDPDDRDLVPALAALGIDARPAVWDDPAQDWAAFDQVVLRSTWDYAPRRAEFLDWARHVPRLANPAGVVAWNTDKRYLDELAAEGVPTVPTAWLAPGVAAALPGGGHHVLKPAVGAGSVDTGRYDLGDPRESDLAVAHVRQLHAAGRTVMLQPYLHAVDTDGETALLYLAGRYSHAVRKGPMLDGPDHGFEGLFRPEEITARQPTPAQRAVADAALAAACRRTGLAEPPLYARVDLIPGPDGSPVLVELELTEPSLFLGYAEGAARRFAAAIAARLAVPATPA
jgi:hypothetical protein